MAGRKFNIAFTTIGTMPFPLFIRMIFSYKVYPRYYLTCIGAGMVSLICEPFRWLEEVLFAKKLAKISLPTSPVFIIGHWRSGTTLLHNVMAQDQQFAFVNTYHSVFANQFFASRWLFKPIMRFLMPEKRPADNVLLATEFPQEEGISLTNVNSFGFYNFFYFPKAWKIFYARYINGESSSEAELSHFRKRYKKLIAQALLEYNRKGFISKFPPNTGNIKQLLQMFPDAKFIYLYRNPLNVLPSTVNFFETTHEALKLQPFSRLEFEEMVFELYEMLITDYERQKSLIPEPNLVEVRYEDFVKEPIDGLRTIYNSLGLPGFEESKSAFDTYLLSQKRFVKANRVANSSEENRIKERLGFAMEMYKYL